MVTLRLGSKKASLASVCKQLALGPEELDRDFGVVAISPEDGLYAVLMDEKAADRIESVEGVQGVFSNPRIEPFGPPR